MNTTLLTPVLPKVADQEKLDRFTKAALAAKDFHVNMPLVHRFTPGMYIREIFMPKGTIVVSRVHRTTHPFVVSKGECDVWCPDRGWQNIKAPYTGITRPGTQRLLLILEDTIWTTFHPGPWPEGTDPQSIVEKVSAAPYLEYLKGAPETVMESLKAHLPALEGGKRL